MTRGERAGEDRDTTRWPRVTVLGASGLIGCALTRSLARRRVRLRAVARRPTPVASDAVAEVEMYTADLTEAGALERAVADSDAVVHLVARMGGVSRWRLDAGDGTAERVNLGLMDDLVEALRSTPRSGPPPVVLFAGTISQVGLAGRTRIDGTEQDRPMGTYDRQKLAAERVLKRATAEGVLRGVSLRMPTVFGHEAGSVLPDRGVISLMVRRALIGEPLTLWHDGAVLRDLIHVDDVARAFVAALDHGERLAGGHWLLGSGRSERLDDVFTRIAEIASQRTGRPPVPVVSVPPPKKAEVTDFHSYEVNASAFHSVTGWRPWETLNGALARTVRSIAEHEEFAGTDQVGPEDDLTMGWTNT